MGEPRIVERDDPQDVFSLLANDTRVEILEALWEAGEPTPFSELNEALEIGDSGRFNYHLDKLVGRFVRKTSDGYELTQAGRKINGAIEAGAYTLEASIEPIELERNCPSCGGTRTLGYEDEVVDIECESCELTFQFVVPPGVFAGYDAEAIPRVASQYLYASVQKIQSGFCWFCDGPMRPTVVTMEAPGETVEAVSDESSSSPGTEPSDRDSADSRDGEPPEIPIVNYRCERCGHNATTGLWLLTLEHPSVAGFFYDHGIDVRHRHFWDFPVLDPDRLDLRSRDPIRASVTYTAGEDSLTLVVDGDAEVVEVLD